MIKLTNIISELSDTAKSKLIQKWTKENSELEPEQMQYYIDMFEKYSANSVFTKKDIFQYKFADLEKIVDSNFSQEKTDKKYSDEFDLSNLQTYKDDLVYEGNGIVILLGDLKEKCMYYGKGKKWCISRQDSSNMFNTYRYAMNDRIFYFVFDRDLPTSNPNHALVVLVDRSNGFFVADADNSKNSGSESQDWNYICKLQPKLKDLKDLFKPIPLSQSDRDEYEMLKNATPEQYLSFNYTQKEKYLSISTRPLNLQMYENTPEELRKKFVVLGHILTKDQYVISSNSVKNTFLKYVEKRNAFASLKPELIELLQTERPEMYLKYFISLNSFKTRQKIDDMDAKHPGQVVKALTSIFDNYNDSYQYRNRGISDDELEYMLQKAPTVAVECIKKFNKYYWTDNEHFSQFFIAKKYFPELEKYIFNVVYPALIASDTIPEHWFKYLSEKNPEQLRKIVLGKVNGNEHLAAHELEYVATNYPSLALAYVDSLKNNQMRLNANEYVVLRRHFPQLVNTLTTNRMNIIAGARSAHWLIDKAWFKQLIKDNPQKVLTFIKQHLDDVKFLKYQIQWAAKTDPNILNGVDDGSKYIKPEAIKQIPPPKLYIPQQERLNQMIELAKTRPNEVKETLRRQLVSKNRVGNALFYMMMLIKPEYADAYFISRVGLGDGAQNSPTPYQFDYAEKTHTLLRYNVNRIKEILQKDA